MEKKRIGQTSLVLRVADTAKGRLEGELRWSLTPGRRRQLQRIVLVILAVTVAVVLHALDVDLSAVLHFAKMLIDAFLSVA